MCNNAATLLTISTKRGMEGITASNVLNDYSGKLVVDGFSAYKSLPSISGIQAVLHIYFVILRILRIIISIPGQLRWVIC